MYEKLIKKIKELGYDSYVLRLAEKVVTELQQKDLHCVDRFIQKLSDRLSNTEDYLDILMEGRIAVFLAKNGFSEVTFIEEDRSHKLPDIKAAYNGNAVYFEITRKRPNEEDEIIKQPGVHWVSHNKTENTMEKIQEKLPQLKRGEINIVVLCSETETLGRPEVEEAFKYINPEIHNEPEKYKELSAVILTESVEEFIKQPFRFHLFKNANASKPLGTSLAKKLESLQS